MSAIVTFNARLKDRLSVPWLTPSEFCIWELIQKFDAPPHRVINIYGDEGTGKTFLAWLMEREKYASYSVWGQTIKPVLPRLVIDDAPSDKISSREIRPLVDRLGVKQIIMLTRIRVDERDLPAFELRVNEPDIEHLSANLFRYLQITMPEGAYRNYKSIITVAAR